MEFVEIVEIGGTRQFSKFGRSKHLEWRVMRNFW